MQERIVELATELVAIPTHETELAAQRYLAGILERAGFEVSLQDVSPERPNLIARRGAGGTFVCSHIDTHPPHDHPDPFECKRDGNLLIGRGVLDAKGQIAALVAAVEENPDVPVAIAICCDEESGGLGSEQLAVPDGPWRADGGIVLEPTDFRFCTAQGGHIDVALEASSPATHAYAYRTLPSSPIDVMIRAFDALRSIRSLGLRHPLLPPPRLSVGRIHGGEHLWRSPGRCRAEVGVGLVPGVTVAEATDQIATALDRTKASWDEPASSFVYKIVDASEPTEVPADLVVASWIADAPGTPLQPGGIMSWTDAANLFARHQLPCVVFGAGDLASAHSDREWVAVDDLVRLAAILGTVFRSAGTAR